MSSITVQSWFIDCADPERLALFWGQLLGCEISRRQGPFVFLEPTPESGTRLRFQRVSEPKRGKLGMHPDLACEDVHVAAARVKELGGKRLTGYEAGGFLVMADPEGNEFCLIPRSGVNMDEAGTAHYL
ncbi:MAG: VOC family protein [Dehalococcoidia bacterium]